MSNNRSVSSSQETIPTPGRLRLLPVLSKCIRTPVSPRCCRHQGRVPHIGDWAIIELDPSKFTTPLESLRNTLPATLYLRENLAVYAGRCVLDLKAPTITIGPDIILEEKIGNIELLIKYGTTSEYTLGKPSGIKSGLRHATPDPTVHTQHRAFCSRTPSSYSILRELPSRTQRVKGRDHGKSLPKSSYCKLLLLTFSEERRPRLVVASSAS
jgi:hypothetical protein